MDAAGHVAQRELFRVPLADERDGLRDERGIDRRGRCRHEREKVVDQLLRPHGQILYRLRLVERLERVETGSEDVAERYAGIERGLGEHCEKLKEPHADEIKVSRFHEKKLVEETGSGLIHGFAVPVVQTGEQTLPESLLRFPGGADGELELLHRLSGADLAAAAGADVFVFLPVRARAEHRSVEQRCDLLHLLGRALFEILEIACHAREERRIARVELHDAREQLFVHAAEHERPGQHAAAARAVIY